MVEKLVRGSFLKNENLPYLWINGLKLFGNMCIAIVCKPGCEVTNFEVKLILMPNKENLKIRNLGTLDQWGKTIIILDHI